MGGKVVFLLQHWKFKMLRLKPKTAEVFKRSSSAEAGKHKSPILDIWERDLILTLPLNHIQGICPTHRLSQPSFINTKWKLWDTDVMSSNFQETYRREKVHLKIQPALNTKVAFEGIYRQRQNTQFATKFFFFIFSFIFLLSLIPFLLFLPV